MTVLRPAPVTSDRFMWSKKDRRFYAEASDLGPGRSCFGRVWDDACDEGLTMVSSRKAGEEVVMVVEHTEVDREGDVRWWDLKPAKLEDRKRVGWTVRVWNDLG